MRSAAQQLLHWIVRWFLWSVLVACTFNPPSRLHLPYPPEGTPLLPIVCPGDNCGENKVFEEPGEMVVYHGWACAVSNEDDRQKYLRVSQRHRLEQRLDRATIFLSGWEFRFLRNRDGEREDHEVGGLGTAIYNVERDSGGLRWEAWGAISDRDFDAPYEWCYHYTLLAWNSGAYTAVVDHSDNHAFLSESDATWETALSYHSRYTDSMHYTTKTAVVAPTLPPMSSCRSSKLGNSAARLRFHMDEPRPQLASTGL
jgi:hypothetical protein